MDEVLASTLQSAVFQQLNYLDRLADNGDQESKASLADTEITRLTGAFRALLADHSPDRHGLCRTCRTAPWRRRGLCTVWRSAYSHLIGNPADRGNERAGRHSPRTPRPAAL